MTWLIILLALLLAFWAIARFMLSGPDLSAFDMPVHEPVNAAPSAENAEVVDSVKEFAQGAGELKGRARLEHLRAGMDAMGIKADLNGVNITPATAAGRPAEWITPSGREPVGRLLYLHGGAFTMGSPRSHRPLTAELARRTGLAVLIVDYRLMPEHNRMAGIEDARAAYRWMLSHGPAEPDGPGGPTEMPDVPVFIAGDSAGGNLTLMLIAWLRDHGRHHNDSAKSDPANSDPANSDLRQADGALALSPLTDATFSSPSMNRNIGSDPMLGPMAKLIKRVPRSLLLWSAWLQNRIRPNDPTVSPVFGDLAGLPPILVQASEAEILIDDARRYVNKAKAAGSLAELETWRGMVHVWPAFGIELPESEQAFSRMAEFVRRVSETRSQANAA